MQRTFQKMPQALPFGIFIGWLRPQPVSSQEAGIRKELVVFELSSLQPTAEAGVALWYNS